MVITVGFDPTDASSILAVPVMEKIKTIEKKIEYRYHAFYCDMCNKELGTSAELEDGYYHKLGEYNQKFWLSDINEGEWFRLERNLCDICKNKLNKKIKNALFDLGFR